MSRTNSQNWEFFGSEWLLSHILTSLLGVFKTNCWTPPPLKWSFSCHHMWLHNKIWCCPLALLPQLQSLLGGAFMARRSHGGRAVRGWPSSRTSSWWMGSWWCRSRASTTSTPRLTSDTATWGRMARTARRWRIGGNLCCSTSIRRWETHS